MHRDSRAREGDDAGRVSPFATSIGDDCRANKNVRLNFNKALCFIKNKSHINLIDCLLYI